MGCNRPLIAYRSSQIGSTGKRALTFKRTEGLTGIPVEVPCGRCMGCRLEHSRQWAVRCMHEKMMHMHSAFVTLTYADEFLPKGRTLVKSDLQLFMKRLRKCKGEGIKFYACGEYGELLARPHYHLLLFGVFFEDQKWHKNSKSGHRLYTSKLLRELWPYGNNLIGEVTFESCGYVASYILKKVKGDRAKAHYEFVTPEGEIIDREPEFAVMSRRPGIGAAWFDKYQRQTLALDSVVARGREMKPPRYYDNRMELVDSVRFEEICKMRRRKALLFRSERSPWRRFVKERRLELLRQQRGEGNDLEHVFGV